MLYTNKKNILCIFLCTFLIFLTQCKSKIPQKAETIKVIIKETPIKKINILTEKEIEEGWKLLFDGHTTKGWREFQRPVETKLSGWYVSNGHLVCRGKGREIITIEKYEDFELMCEWKVSRGGNSGILYRVSEEGVDASYKSGPEYQIIDDGSYPIKLKKWQKAGANYALHPPINSRVKPVGEYNITRIVVNGDHIEHWLNGIKVVEYHLWTDEWKKLAKKGKGKFPRYGLEKTGYIALQVHSNTVWYKNIKIKKL